MSKPFDATLKEIVSQSPKDFQPIFGLPKIDPVISLNVDLSTISAATDIALGFGDPLREIVDLNFQAGPDSAVGTRLHVYNAVLHSKFDVPVRTVLVLLRSEADHRNIDGKVSYRSGKTQLHFEYEIIRLWKQDVQPFLEGGIGLLPLATLCKMHSGGSLEHSLQSVVKEIDRRLSKLSDHAHAVRLMSAVYTLASTRVPSEVLPSVFSGVNIMHKPTAYDEMEAIEIRTTQRMLLLQGREKFGDPDAKIEGSLRRTKELARLERMAQAILGAKSWKDLLAVR